MVLLDLLSVLFGGTKGESRTMAVDFRRMLELAETMFSEVNVALWGEAVSKELVKETYERDILINQLERSIRKQAMGRLTANPGPSELPYCFVLINVVKDAERIGDYVKNLVELNDIASIVIPEGSIRTELRAIGQEIEAALARVGPVFDAGDREEAEALVRKGRELSKQADQQLPRISAAGYDSNTTVTLVLMSRFYKRVICHTVNILSTVIMPLHKIDYFDEEELVA